MKRISQGTDSALDNLVETERWYWKLLHPIELFGLIKRYHMTGNTATILFFCHLLFLVHVTIKSILHTFLAGNDRQKIDYFNSIYYPHMAGWLPEPYLFNNLFLALCLQTLCIRFISAYNLVRSSIINADTYKELKISQLCLPVITMYHLTLKDWGKLLKHSVTHRIEVRRDPKLRAAHFKFSEQSQSQLEYLPTKDLLFYMNMIDHDECYRPLNIFKMSNRRSIYKMWHCAPPTLRTSLEAIRDGASLGFIAGLIAVAGFATTFIGVVFYELRSSFPPDAQVSNWEVFASCLDHLSKPMHCQRLFELFMLVALQSPVQCDSVLVTLQLLMLISRANKLRRVIENEASLKNDNILTKQFSLSKGAEKSPTNSGNKSLNSYHCFIKTPTNNQKDHGIFENNETVNMYKMRSEFNKKIEHYVVLVRLIYLEFNTIRKSESLFLNLLVIGNAICITYTVALLFSIKSTGEAIILGAVLVNAIIPTIDSLVMCAGAERSVSLLKTICHQTIIRSLLYLTYFYKQFRQLYRLMTKLMVNKDLLLEPRTIKHIRICSEQFEKKENRSFMILNLYAISPETVIPVS